jgi:hypothetical protein
MQRNIKFTFYKNAMPQKKKKELPQEQAKELLEILKTRFEKNMQRHKGVRMGKSSSQAGSKQRKAVVVAGDGKNRWGT